jgi:hypothetical protein
MPLNSTAPLKWGAVVLAVLWTGTMLWRTGATGSLELFVLAFCGVVCSYGWYNGARFYFGRFGLLPPEHDETAEARRGKIYPWIVFAVAMIVTRQVTIWSLDVVDPLIPAGNWQQSTKALFIIFVWPGLMGALRPLIRRYLPPPKRRASRCPSA